MTQPKPPIRSTTDSLELAGVAGQAGCVTLGVVLVALIAGLWLDRQLGTRYIVTILLIVASVPLSIWLMLKIVLRGMARFHAEHGNVPVPSGERPVGGLWRKPAGAAHDKDEDEDEDNG